MIKTYRCEIFPTRKQRSKLKGEFGARSWIYGKFITIRRNRYKRGNFYYSDMCELLPEIKRENPWLYGINPQSLQAILWQLDKTFKRLDRNKDVTCRPYYKKFTSLPIIYPAMKPPIEIENKHIQIPKIGWIPFQNDRIIDGVIKTVVIYKIKHKCKYFAYTFAEKNSMLEDTENEMNPTSSELDERLNRSMVKHVKEKFMRLKEYSIGLNPKDKEEFNQYYDRASNFLTKAKGIKSCDWQQAACYVLDARDCLEKAQKLFSNEFHDGLFCNDKFVKRA